MGRSKHPSEEIKFAFAARLRAAMETRGWTAGRTGGEACWYLGEGEKVSDAHMWHYLRGRSIPRARYLEAIAQALNVGSQELLTGIEGSDRNSVTVLDPVRPL